MVHQIVSMVKMRGTAKVKVLVVSQISLCVMQTVHAYHTAKYVIMWSSAQMDLMKCHVHLTRVSSLFQFNIRKKIVFSRYFSYTLLSNLVAKNMPLSTWVHCVGEGLPSLHSMIYHVSRSVPHCYWVNWKMRNKLSQACYVSSRYLYLSGGISPRFEGPQEQEYFGSILNLTDHFLWCPVFKECSATVNVVSCTNWILHLCYITLSCVC